MTAGHVAACVLIVAACRHAPAIPPLPGEGGPAWLELETDHFTLWTDASAWQGRELMRIMERHRQVVHGIGFAHAEALGGRSFVVALRDDAEVAAYIPGRFAAFAWGGGGALHQPMILVSAETVDDHAHVVAHELSHVISFAVIHNQPRWFSEGLASFFGAVDLDLETGRAFVGNPPSRVLARLKRRPPRPAAVMFACDDDACMDETFYATAWAIYTFLANRYPDGLRRFAARLDGLSNKPVIQAWHDVFPQLPLAQLDIELRAWLVQGEYRTWEFQTAPGDSPIRQRALGDADVHAVRALLRQRFDATDPRARRELAAALARDPTHLLANMLAFELDGTVTEDAARRVAAAHPDDWRAWRLLLAAVNGSAETAEVRDRLCVLLRRERIPTSRKLCPTP